MEECSAFFVRLLFYWEDKRFRFCCGLSFNKIPKKAIENCAVSIKQQDKNNTLNTHWRSGIGEKGRRNQGTIFFIHYVFSIQVKEMVVCVLWSSRLCNRLIFSFLPTFVTLRHIFDLKVTSPVPLPELYDSFSYPAVPIVCWANHKALFGKLQVFS